MRVALEEVVGIWRVAAVLAVPGVNWTEMVQVALGARVAQVVVGTKLELVAMGVAIWSGVEEVLVRVMVWRVALGPGRLLKLSAVGLRLRPGSVEPKPVSEVAMGPALVWRMRLPVRGPTAVGAKVSWKKQEAWGLRVPAQVGLPAGVGASGKSPVVVGAERVMGAGLAVRLVRVKRMGELVLLTGMEPKSGLRGVRVIPARESPVPLRVS